jgi:hypothetical protein
VTARAEKHKPEKPPLLTVDEGRKIAEHNKRLIDGIRRMVVGLAALIVVLGVGQIALAYLNDRASCERSQPTRQAFAFAATYFAQQALRAEARAQVDPSPQRVLDLQAARAAVEASKQLAVPQLKCSQLFPEVH